MRVKKPRVVKSLKTHLETVVVRESKLPGEDPPNRIPGEVKETISDLAESEEDE
jgi:hypothetical protein